MKQLVIFLAIVLGSLTTAAVADLPARNINISSASGQSSPEQKKQYYSSSCLVCTPDIFVLTRILVHTMLPGY
jgi:hypothetical protein